MNLSLCGWHLDEGHNDNTMSRAAMVAAIVEHHTLRIDAYQELTGDKAIVDDHYYSDKAPLPALIVVPFWWCAVRLGIVHIGEHGLLTDGLLRLGGFLCGSIPLAVIITLVWLMLCERNVEVKWRTVLAALPFYGSFLFVYSGSFYAHLLGACFVLLAWNALRKEAFARCGFWCGAAVLCEYTLLVVPVVFMLQPLFKHRWKSALLLLIGGLPAAIGLLTYNALTTGHAFTPLYAHEANYTFMSDGFGIALPSLRAVWGLTFSTYRGVFIYMPALLVMLIAAALVATQHRRLRLGLPALTALVSVLAVSSYAMWWGGWAYGPRHLCAAAVLLFVPFAPMLHVDARWRIAIVMASMIGLLMAWAAKSTVSYSLPTEEHSPLINIIWPRLLEGAWSGWQLPQALGISAGGSSLLFPFFFVLGLLAMSRIDRSTAPTT